MGGGSQTEPILSATVGSVPHAASDEGEGYIPRAASTHAHIIPEEELQFNHFNHAQPARVCHKGESDTGASCSPAQGTESPVSPFLRD